MGGLALALLALTVLHGAGAPEPLENDSEPGKSGGAGKPWKAAPSLAELDLDTAGGGAEWTSWFNIDHPGGDGDYESLDAIRFYYGERVCQRPVAIQARTTGWELPAAVGEVVHASPKKGFRCVNKEQPPGKTCSNYHVRFLCPLEYIYWSHWSSWSPCSRSACSSGGTQTRTRRCVNARRAAALKELKCKGKAVERRPCRASPCPESAWAEWGAWGPCSRSCGGAGTRVRRRSCKMTKKAPCAGRPTEVQKCATSPCPACPERTLQGTVVSATGAALPDAHVYLEGRPPVLLARSDARGRFTATGLCEGTATNVSAHREGFATGLAPVVSNGSGVAVATVVLQRLEKPFMVLHPKAKVRVAGQDVTFCCKASGTPVPKKYYWYHNGTLLERTVHRYGSHLVLQGLVPAQAGTYHCKASSEAGAIRSAPAQLTVLAQGQQSCKPEPEPSLVELPGECQLDTAGSRYYNVGRCPPVPCAGGPAERSGCRADAGRCCGVRRMEMREIPCAGSPLPVKVVAECGCGPP